MAEHDSARDAERDQADELSASRSGRLANTRAPSSAAQTIVARKTSGPLKGFRAPAGLYSIYIGTMFLRPLPGRLT